MDANVFITIVFSLEVVLVGLAVVIFLRKQLVLKPKHAPVRRRRRNS
jgi:hypothetical protein